MVTMIGVSQEHSWSMLCMVNMPDTDCEYSLGLSKGLLGV
jgi:hypothetical protein